MSTNYHLCLKFKVPHTFISVKQWFLFSRNYMRVSLHLVYSGYGRKCSMCRLVVLVRSNGNKYPKIWFLSISHAYKIHPNVCSILQHTIVRWTKYWTFDWYNQVSKIQNRCRCRYRNRMWMLMDGNECGRWCMLEGTVF